MKKRSTLNPIFENHKEFIMEIYLKILKEYVQSVYLITVLVSIQEILVLIKMDFLFQEID